MLLIAHGDAHVDMFYFSEFGLEFAHISDALLVDSHDGK